MPGVDEFFGRVAALHREGAAFAIATVVSRRGPVSSHPGDRAIVFADGVMEGFVGGSCSREAVRAQALDALAQGEPRLVSIRPDADAGDDRDGIVGVPMTCGSKGAVDVYIEPFARARTVVVVGLTPVAEAVVRLATTLEYQVVHAVAREELRDVAAGPRAIAVDELAAFLAAQPFAARVQLAIVVASQGHYDSDALDAVLHAGAPYVGLVASRRRAAEVRAELAGRGHDPAAIEALHVPAGLDLGARHPAEVALSILAEVVQLHPSPRAFGAGVATTAAARGAPRLVRDPVCGMEVALVDGAIVAEHAGGTYGFCCDGCRQRFLADPAAYLAEAAG